MQKIELEIVALSHTVTQSHSYAVVLGEKNGLRRLPIVIGAFEAQAIAVALENMHPTRPLTHDLLRNIMNAFSVTLTEIIIYKIVDGIFYAQLICKSDKQQIEIDSRTSDALAMAVRFDAPIFTYDSILNTAGLELDISTENEKNIASVKKNPTKISPSTHAENTLQNLTIEQLNEMLQKVLEYEDYIKAAQIRDEIKNRNTA